MYENVDFKYNNFCIAPLVNTFASIDTTNTTAVLQIRNTSGAVQANYDLNPTLSQGLSVDSLVYVGPVNTSTLADGMPFFTLEHVSSSSCSIKRWEMNDTFNRLDLVQTLNISNHENYNFDCYSMSIEHYTTEFSYAEGPATGHIEVDSVIRLSIGDHIYLGPSTHASNMNAFEEVSISSISGTLLEIAPTASGVGSATEYYYNAGDPVTYYKDILLFSDVGMNNSTTKGTLYRLDSTTGTVSGTNTNGMYKDIIASCYGIPYYNTVGFIKTANLLYVDIDDYEVKKSVVLVNTESDDRTIVPTTDLEFTTTSVFRLQKKITLRDDVGEQHEHTWVNYNYHQDGVVPYVDNITMWAYPNILSNQEQTTIYVLVRDQYGNALSNITVYFDKVSGDSAGGYDDINKQAVTNIEGIASLTYTCGWSEPTLPDTCCEDIVLNAKAAGSNVFTGSEYVWGNISVQLKKKYIHVSPEGFIEQKIDSKEIDLTIIQLAVVAIEYVVHQWKNFSVPRGRDSQTDSGLRNLFLLKDFEEEINQTLLPDFEGTAPLVQLVKKEDDLQISQTYISRHLPYGHQDTVEVNQFRFLVDALPLFWSEKNSIDTDIWIKLAPFGFDLDQITLEFNVREVSHAGDTGFIDYANTEYITVLTFDAGGGLLGLDITVNPPTNFHHNGVVYVFITVYDKATPTNKITIDYWFKLLADYKAPFIINEWPGREALDVPVDTDIHFDIMDYGVGVDIDTLEFYVNNRLKTTVTTTISGGYHVHFDATKNYHYGQTTEITVRAKDASDQENYLFDTYRFHCIGSSGPWFDPQSFVPEDCKSAVYRKLGEITLNVYDINDTGLDKDSITLDIDKKTRLTTITPIMLRIE